VFTSLAKQDRFLALLRERPGAADGAVLTQALPVKTTRPSALDLLTALFSGNWIRPDGSDASVANV